MSEYRAPGNLQILKYLIRRDSQVALRQRSEVLNPIIFLLVVITLFPLAVGPSAATLSIIAPGVIWVSALLSAMLGLERMFRDDFRDGSLEHMLLLPCPIELSVLSKIIVHWLLTALPLVVMSPLLALLLSLPLSALPILVFTLLLGTPVLSAVGAIGVALTVSLNRGGALLSLLMLPLLIPLLIFATAAIEAATMGMSAAGPLAFMAAFMVLALGLSPLAVRAALQVSVN